MKGEREKGSLSFQAWAIRGMRWFYWDGAVRRKNGLVSGGCGVTRVSIFCYIEFEMPMRHLMVTSSKLEG